MKKIFRFEVDEEFQKKRLDEFIFTKFPLISRIYLRRQIRDGKCQVNGNIENRGYLLRKNDFVEIEIEVDEKKDFQPEPIEFEIFFEDKDILIINKPAGMIVHPTRAVRSGTLLNGLAYYFSQKDNAGLLRAGLVHRLDKETSGLMVVAKNAESLRALAGEFQRKQVEKRYFALVEGKIDADHGMIEAPIGKFKEEVHFWGIRSDGKPARTNFWVRERFSEATLLELEPVTGRTNQLRVHLAHIGHPIIGDEKYGGKRFARLCLHSCKLAFLHPRTKKKLTFETEIPKDFCLKQFSIQVSEFSELSS